MKYLVVYSSLTGNTKKIAEAIMDIMPEDTDIFPVKEAPSPAGYDVILIGSWIQRGLADKKSLEYIQTIRGKKTASFSTLGAYPDSDHALTSLKRIKEFLMEKETIL